MSKRRHGGLAEILAVRQAPSARVSGTGKPGIRAMVVPGLTAPKGGWTSADEIDRACAAARAPGAADSEMVKNFNKGIRSPIVDVDR
jgi:hypothetical protein